jgi:hypothetical protein
LFKICFFFNQKPKIDGMRDFFFVFITDDWKPFLYNNGHIISRCPCISYFPFSNHILSQSQIEAKVLRQGH